MVPGGRDFGCDLTRGTWAVLRLPPAAGSRQPERQLWACVDVGLDVRLHARAGA
jgi:hypothetical protein